MPSRIDFATLHKVYGIEQEKQTRYSPAKILSSTTAAYSTPAGDGLACA